MQFTWKFRGIGIKNPWVSANIIFVAIQSTQHVMIGWLYWTYHSYCSCHVNYVFACTIVIQNIIQNQREVGWFLWLIFWLEGVYMIFGFWIFVLTHCRTLTSCAHLIIFFFWWICADLIIIMYMPHLFTISLLISY